MSSSESSRSGRGSIGTSSALGMAELKDSGAGHGACDLPICLMATIWDVRLSILDRGQMTNGGQYRRIDDICHGRVSVGGTSVGHVLASELNIPRLPSLASAALDGSLRKDGCTRACLDRTDKLLVRRDHLEGLDACEAAQDARSLTGPPHPPLRPPSGRPARPLSPDGLTYRRHH